MKKIKLCIFDMDGLLIDTERYVWSVGEQEIGKEFGVDIPHQLTKDLMGVSRQTFVSSLKNIYGQDFPAEEFLNKLVIYYKNYCINEEIPLRPGAKELLHFLKSNGILISLGTSTEKEYAEIALKKAGLYNYFDYMVCGDQVKEGKPNPEIYTKSVEHFNLKPEECIVFEDTPIGAQAAYNGNINLVLVPDIKIPTDLDKEKALAIIQSLYLGIPLIKTINEIN